MPLVKQPNSAHCFVCGLHNPLGMHLSFYAVSDTEVTAAYTAPAAYEGYPGVLHGGIIAALLDEVGVRVTMIVDYNHFMVTAHSSVKYRQPTPTGQPLTIVGRLVSRRGRLATTTAEVRLADGTVTASAELTLVDMPGGALSAADLAALGWQVYPDPVDTGVLPRETSSHG
jgi:uncharacterized protein (TIGR00369 family)